MLIAGCGGFVGTCLRYLTGILCNNVFHGFFPWATVVVNLIGCFIIGLSLGLIEKTHILTPNENILLVVGFCGGFTTFSTFANDIFVIASKGNWCVAVGYIAISVVLGILLVWGGRSLIR